MRDVARFVLRQWLDADAGRSRAGALNDIADEDPENPSSWLSLDYIHDRVLDQLAAQDDRWESADARLRLILGLIGVVFAVASSFVSRGAAPGPERTAGAVAYLSSWVGGPLALGFLLYLLAGLIALGAYWPIRFWRPPEPALLRKEYLTTDVRVTKLETMDTVILFLVDNENMLNANYGPSKLR